MLLERIIRLLCGAPPSLSFPFGVTNGLTKSNARWKRNAVLMRLPLTWSYMKMLNVQKLHVISLHPRNNGERILIKSRGQTAEGIFTIVVSATAAIYLSVWCFYALLECTEKHIVFYSRIYTRYCFSRHSLYDMYSVKLPSLRAANLSSRGLTQMRPGVDIYTTYITFFHSTLRTTAYLSLK